MVNKILISKNKRIILHRDKRTLGMNGENLQEVLLFVLDEKIEGTGIVEVELPDGTKGMIEVSRREEGYELPVKSSLLTQTGFVKFQLRILHDDVEIFKSEILALEVKDSINATATIPEEYPSWIDTLTNLKQDLEKAEQERVSNENERISAEEERQENFTEMQKTVESAVSNIKDLTEEYNSNAEKETKKFNDNAAEQTKSFNENSDTKLAEYNKTHTDKMKEFNDNYDAKTKAFDDNAESKQNEYDQNAENKLTEYNQNAEELINKVEQVQAENEALKAENKLIKEQIPRASVSGNSVHIEDSSNLDFNWKIRGRHYQKQTIQNDNLLILEDTTITKNGITLTIKDGVITIDGTSTASTNIDFKIKKKLKAGTYRHMVQRDSGSANGNISFLIMKSSGSVSTMNGSGGANFTLEEDTEVFYRIWTDKNNTISNVVYKCIISEGSDSKPWVQGIPDSPSLDYPSEIETVGSNVNEFDCKESYTNKGLTLTKYKDGSFKIEGIPTVTTTFAISDYFKLQGVYTFKAEWLEGTSPHFWFYSNINKKNTVELTPTNGVKVVTLNNEDEIILGINIEKGKVYSFTARVKIEKGTVATPYSPYNQGSVKIDVVNKNLLNIANTEETTKGGITYSVKNGILKLNGTATVSFDIQLSKNIKIKKGKYTHSSNYIQSGLYISFDNLSYTMISATVGKKRKIEITEDTIYKRYFIWIDKGTVLNNVEMELQLEVGDTATDFVEHQSQTAIMPIQQEMLEGDYVADIEYHEWGKLVLTGNENFVQAQNANKLNYFYSSLNSVKIKGKIISNMLKNIESGIIWNKTSYDDVVSSASNSKTINIMLSDTTITTLQQFKEKLKELYNAGTPIIIYYELTESIDLELTSEQKTVRNQKLYTYKNITNINVSDELASVEVEYKKDQDTINKNYENRLAALEAASIS